MGGIPLLNMRSRDRSHGINIYYKTGRQSSKKSHLNKKEKMANRFFKFNLEQFRDRTARRYGLRRTSYHLRVTNPPETRPTRHANIVREFEEGLTDAIDNLIEDLPDHDRIQLYLSSNRLRSAHTSAPVSVGGWIDTMGVSRQILNQISKMLNSNENFEVDDTLQLDITHVKMPEPGTGKRRWKFGMDNYTELLLCAAPVNPIRL